MSLSCWSLLGLPSSTTFGGGRRPWEIKFTGEGANAIKEQKIVGCCNGLMKSKGKERKGVFRRHIQKIHVKISVCVLCS